MTEEPSRPTSIPPDQPEDARVEGSGDGAAETDADPVTVRAGGAHAGAAPRDGSPVLTARDHGAMTTPPPPGRSLRIGYLSGSPRIATRADTEVFGPRAHILGVIEALRSDGHAVEDFILGDRVSASASGEGSRRLVTGGRTRQLTVDVARLGLRVAVRRRARRALTGPFDLVYERYALFQELGRPFQRAGVPWVVETNAVLAHEARLERDALALQRLAASLERRTYAHADLVVCVSGPLRQLLVERAGVAPEKIAVVPNGVDLARFRAAPLPAPTPAADLVVGFVGFVIERQGLDELIGAVAVLRRRGVRVRALVIGDGPDRDRLEQRAVEVGVADHVDFHDQVPWPEVPARIASFTVGYSGQRGVAGMPMYHSPLKLYEYLAMARPVVASDHRDARSAVAGSGAGWTFPPGDQDALVEVLAAAAALSPEELEAMGRRGRRHVEEHHTWAHRSRQLLGELADRGLT